ncbi:MAG: hypothetical protein N3G21_03795 [Candidatus Hydrogenedentes bacterium]|nr:hypothetical protein [Candidatus Hydrogenedentota bacterium]
MWCRFVYIFKLRSRAKCFIVALVLICFNAPEIYARDSFELHKVDYYAVLGIEKETGGNIEKLLSLINEIIDQKGGNSEFIRRLKDEFGLAFGGAQKHRYVFHWGFNIDLKYHKPLIKELDRLVREDIERQLDNEEGEYYKEYQERKEEIDRETYIDEKTEERKEEILEFINEERAEQNRNLINTCMELTGLNRSMSAGLITILWDIHVLSDYLGQKTEGLLEFSSLSIDLRNHGLERLFEMDKRNGRFKSKYDAVIKQLDWIYGSYRTERERACGFINFLCGYSDCNSQASEGYGAIANLIKESEVVKGILNKKGISIK